MHATTLYQINSRALLTELSCAFAKPATLDDIPDQLLDSWKDHGFEWIWMLGVWQTGVAAQTVSRTHPGWRHDYQASLSDLREEDIEGSCFAIVDYQTHSRLGSDAALQRLRQRLRDRGMFLMLDFVPNHMALDHSWIASHPECFVRGSEERMRNEPMNFFRAYTGEIFAHGKDPYFDGWPDTVQLDYSHPTTIHLMSQELDRIAKLCDGLRCDMAMLILPDVTQRTWGSPALPFWKENIERIKANHPGFCFLAEVYWDREWDLQQLGFDYCYDKRLYDRVLHEGSEPVRLHLLAGLDYQNRLARFLENHDEKRAQETMSNERHRAAAIVTYLSPGMKFFHEGQLEGRRVKISPHLIRRPVEEINVELQSFYGKLLGLLKEDFFRNGRWLLLDGKPAWPGDESYIRVISFRWKGQDGRHLIVSVNFSDLPASVRLRVSIDRTCASDVVLRDWFSETRENLHRGQIFNPGLEVNLEPWGFRVLEEIDS
ncbi:MAG: alpha-amylase family glycosyl hydrolase [Pirellula sp.]|jgi:glycosidase|nr:alpha-amylase family glycosyl hydrolase [Pirellula sp.]